MSPTTPKASEAVASKDTPLLLNQEAMEKIVNDPLHSLNSLPAAEGGLPADELKALRSIQDTIDGVGALGQPGQEGHGEGTVSTVEPTDEEKAANEAEYQKRISS